MTVASQASALPDIEPSARTAAVEVRNLRVRFGAGAETVYAVNGVSFTVAEGETVGLVGESGCGKSTAGFALMRLLPSKGVHLEGDIAVAGSDLAGMGEKQLRALRGRDVAMIYQDPMTTLNPVLTVGEQIEEGLLAHTSMSRNDARNRALELLDMVGISDPFNCLDSFPHEISGGMRQRVVIAMAVGLNPKVLIADEPTTALDVTTQAQILKLLRTLTDKMGTALVMITHDLGVVAGVTQRVNVMYAGYIVESASTEDLFEAPRHPYTVGLMGAVPRIGAEDMPLIPIAGSPPDQRELPPGCPFAPRCRWRVEACWVEMPVLTVCPQRVGHRVACHNPVESKEAAARVAFEGVECADPPSSETRFFRSAIRFDKPSETEGLRK